jgi:hypothetical protein
MFCGEHGTLDYCPECLSEERDGVLEKRVKELEDLVHKLHACVPNNPSLDDEVDKVIRPLYPVSWEALVDD